MSGGSDEPDEAVALAAGTGAGTRGPGVPRDRTPDAAPPHVGTPGTPAPEPRTPGAHGDVHDGAHAGGAHGAAPRGAGGHHPADSGRPGTHGGAPARSHGNALAWPEARAFAARTADALPTRAVPLEAALHHTLGAPLDALTDLPSFDTSAMDGWAVAGPGPWRLPAADDPAARGVLAGDRREPRRLADGDAVRIATGARVPPGTHAVLRSEYGEVRGDRLARRDDAPRNGAGTDIRPRGQECRTGDRLLPEGTVVTPAVLGLAAAAGYDELAVTRRPRAEVLVLGDELLHRGRPHDGRIRDALGPMVGPWLTALGAEVPVTRRLGDDAEALFEALATTTADLVVTTGGTAHGPVDHVRPTLRRLGARLLIDGVRVRPGHPMLLARVPVGSTGSAGSAGSAGPAGLAGSGPGAEAAAGTRGGTPGRTVHLVGLPGNPLAALSGLMTLAAPLLRTLAARPQVRDPYGALSEAVHGHPRDTRLVPVRYAPGEAGARPLHYAGPAMLRGVATASALAVVPPGGVAEGGEVRLLPLPWMS